MWLSGCSIGLSLLTLSGFYVYDLVSAQFVGYPGVGGFGGYPGVGGYPQYPYRPNPYSYNNNNNRNSFPLIINVPNTTAAAACKVTICYGWLCNCADGSATAGVQIASPFGVIGRKRRSANDKAVGSFFN